MLAKPQEKPKQETKGNPDRDIAASSLVSMMLSQDGSQTFLKAMSSPEPVKAVALLISQVIEMTIAGLQKAEIELDPAVWLAPDGALDDASKTLFAYAKKQGVNVDASMLDAIKQEVAQLLVQRGESMRQQEQGGQPPPTGPAPSPSGAPSPQGGMV